MKDAEMPGFVARCGERLMARYGAPPVVAFHSGRTGWPTMVWADGSWAEYVNGVWMEGKRAEYRKLFPTAWPDGERELGVQTFAERLGAVQTFAGPGPRQAESCKCRDEIGPCPRCAEESEVPRAD